MLALTSSTSAIGASSQTSNLELARQMQQLRCASPAELRLVPIAVQAWNLMKLSPKACLEP